MDYEKIGEFILECRKEKNLTQKQLAEKIGVTDKAVSKWERGLGCPDVSILGELANVLDIGIGELLNGEKDESLKDNNEFIKQAVLFSKKNTQNNIYRKISYILTITIALLSVYVIFMNVFQLGYINNKTDYYLEEEQIKSIKEKYDSIYDSLQKLKNSDFEIKNNETNFNEYIISKTEYYLELIDKIELTRYDEKVMLTTPEVINIASHFNNYNLFNHNLIYVLKNINQDNYDLFKILANYTSVVNNLTYLPNNYYSVEDRYYYIDLYDYSSINYEKYDINKIMKNLIYNMEIYDELLSLIVKEGEING